MAVQRESKVMTGDVPLGLEIKCAFQVPYPLFSHLASGSSNRNRNRNCNHIKCIVAVFFGLPLSLGLITVLAELILEPERRLFIVVSCQSAAGFLVSLPAQLLGWFGGEGNPAAAVHGHHALWPNTTAPTLKSLLASLVGVDVPALQQQRPEAVSIKSDVKRPHVLIVSAIQEGCSTATGEDVVLRGLKNKVDYARLHGMDIEHCSIDVPIEPSEERRWHKIAVIQEKMRSFPDYDWYMWLDYDSLIMDMAFEIPWETYSAHSLVIWGMAGALYTAKKLPVTMLSTSTMYIQNSETAKKLLDRVVEVCKDGYNDVDEVLSDKPENWTVNEQFALLYVLSREQGLWRRHVFLENNYHICRYWADENDRLEEYYSDWRGEGQFPPFIMNFVGCGFCIRNSEQCVRQFHRATRFADNQLLSAFGMTHKSLDSAEVVRLPASIT